MDSCDKTLKEFINEMSENCYSNEGKALTSIGYYIACQLSIEILESIDYLHQNNIIHRDLKPSNIMLKRDSRRFIRIVDFGLIAIHEFGDQSHSSDAGDYDYIAPEVYAGRIYDTKADIYSLGITLSHLFYIDIKK
jgi:protein-serine/threonine kinase